MLRNNEKIHRHFGRPLVVPDLIRNPFFGGLSMDPAIKSRDDEVAVSRNDKMGVSRDHKARK
jgi:hypothetical protein